MHLAEGLLPASQAAATWALATPFIFDGARQTRRLTEQATPHRTLLGLAAAIGFALTVFPIPVPIVGVSSHLCATPLLALLVGPRVTVFFTALILFLEATLFGHGGLTTLGANTLSLGVVGAFAGVGLARGLRCVGVPTHLAVGFSCLGAHLLVYATAALLAAAALAGEQSMATWFAGIVSVLAPFQLPLAAVEALVAVGIVRAVARRRPGMLPAWLGIPVLSSTRKALTTGIVGLAFASTVLVIPSSAVASAEGAFEEAIEVTREQMLPHSSPEAPPPEEASDTALAIGMFLAGMLFQSSLARLTRPEETSDVH